jgi:predicted DNA-binding transcriptional regulator AlpA
MSSPKVRRIKPKRICRHHHIDKRAAQLVAENIGSGGDDLLTTTQVAVWLCVSIPWLEIGRGRGYGPPFVRLTKRCVRYKRAAVRAWLEERAHHSTAEYLGEQEAV